jgi:hypothetical protein
MDNMAMEVAKQAAATRHTGGRWKSPDNATAGGCSRPPHNGHGWFAQSYGRIEVYHVVVIVYVMPDVWVAVAADAVLLR